ncbi:hypothetical protein F4810DRAFT_650181 [Camillea tinctor]|nr:hypothetical protein F4810DRAFT_650181 [Camillea tinctor]
MTLLYSRGLRLLCSNSILNHLNPASTRIPFTRNLSAQVMAGSYDIHSYLLDRANIHDTVTRLTFHIDTKSVEGLINEVYAPNLVIDYTSMFGGEPQQTTGEEWSQKVGSMMARYDETHHVVTGLLIQLPQPTSKANRPDKCTVLSNVTAHMVRRNVKGEPIVHDGGRYILDLIRLPELEEKEENPWRISKQAFTASWYDGNMEVLNAASENVGKEDKD